MVHCDYVEPISAVDTSSKWPEAFVVLKVNSKKTLQKPRERFARFDFPVSKTLLDSYLKMV